MEKNPLKKIEAKGVNKKYMTKITEHEERIKNLEINAIKLTKEVTELHKLFDKESAPTKEFGEDVKKLEKVKTEILGYTFQSVTIVVGILALVLAVVFLWLNVANLTNAFFGLFVGIIIFFGGILVMWFILWIIRD